MSSTRSGARRRSTGRGRYELTTVYHLAARLRASGVDLDRANGPWRARERRVKRPGASRPDAMAVVTNESTEVMVDTREHAVDVAGLLNWCGVHDLTPVPELTPPTF